MDFIPIAKPFIDIEEADSVYKQVKSGWISMGKKVKQFESMIQDYLSVKHAIAFSNGTATLHASLLALNVKQGDEVLVPSLSYVSSANAVVFCGAKPVFVEENEKTFLVDPDSFEKKITSKTKAIMTVDLKGMPVDFDSMNSLSKKHGIPIISDSAESLGAKYKNNLVGNQALVHSFSLFANKNITTGEGGIITTNDDDIAKTCQCIRNQGQSERYVHVMIGHNYRMTDIVASIGIPQLNRVEFIMSEKNKLASKYNQAFLDHPLIQTPYVPEHVSRHSWYMYCLMLDDSINRDRLAELMIEKGVDYRLSFPPIPLQPIYKEMYGYKEGDFPNSERIFNQFIDIPCWVGMSDDQVQHVINTILDSVENSKH